MAIRLKTVWTLRITPRHQSTYITILIQQDRDTSSVNATSLVNATLSSVYVNSIVNSNVYSTVHVNNTVHVNSAIFPFMLRLRFSTVLSSKVMSVLPSDLSFILK
ncbi:hypothetical protein CUMW_275990 [Citrus unshiu]|uniref:Uncharacterized protein n=1 Tax=Citrus unshiu TaxID=55188 RepID=A0A2H5N096_CITUN|nr:hypothetical protein CUMW_275990 [Citrus unshiu]